MKSEELRNIRKEYKYTQIEMAKQIGVSAVTYIGWEQGKNSPNFENNLKIEKFLKGQNGIN